MTRYQSHTQALKDIINHVPKDSRRTGFYGELERYTTTYNDVYNKEQRLLNKRLGIKNINYFKNEARTNRR